MRYMDSRPDEQQRGITMKSSSVALYHFLKYFFSRNFIFSNISFLEILFFPKCLFSNFFFRQLLYLNIYFFKNLVIQKRM